MIPTSSRRPSRRATLTVDLDAVAANYRTLRACYGGPVQAVVKRDAYGLGLTAVAPVLAAAGCDTFFAEDLEEGCRLRLCLTRAGWPDAVIYALNGVGEHPLERFRTRRIRPVLGTAPDLMRLCRWARSRPDRAAALPVALHLETGFGRLGLEAADLDRAGRDLDTLAVRHVMTHLAEMATPDSPGNLSQRAAFLTLAARFPGAEHSVASSAFAFAGPLWRLGAARVGSALYGTRHVADPAYRTRPVASLSAPVLDCETVPAGAHIGYGRFQLSRDSRLAIIQLGYADGLPRTFWDRPRLYLNGRACPVLPEVSMMHCYADVTDLPEPPRAGAWAQVFGADPAPDINTFARDMGLKPNVLLTQIGRLVARQPLPATPVDHTGPHRVSREGVSPC